MRTRWALVALVTLGMGAGIWLLWPRAETRSTGSEPVAADTTTSSEPTTSTVPASTTSTSTTTPAESHVVETVEEAEEILRELWFGWFEGIYNQDEDRIREVVATETAVEAAISQFGAQFTGRPNPTEIDLAGVEILFSDDECLVTWSQLDVSDFRGPDAIVETVVVARWHKQRWTLMSTWTHRNDLWEADCNAVLSA